MTPNDIDVLIHYHSSRSTHPRYDAPAVQESITDFLDQGIFVNYCDNATIFQTTELGRALVAVLCQTPFPVASFVNPWNGKQVDF